MLEGARQGRLVGWISGGVVRDVNVSHAQLHSERSASEGRPAAVEQLHDFALEQ